MNVTTWAPFLALLAPAAAAAYPMLRDRSALTRVERLTQVIKNSPDSALPLTPAELSVLGVVRRNSIGALGKAWVSKDHRYALVGSWWALAWALLVAASQLWVLKTDHVVVWSAVLGWVEVGVLGLISVFGFRRYRKRIKADTKKLHRLLNADLEADAPASVEDPQSADEGGS